MGKTKKLKILITLTYFICFLFLITDVLIFYTKTTSKTKVPLDSVQETPQPTLKNDSTTNPAIDTTDKNTAAPASIALSATADTPQVTDEGSTPDNCYLHVRTPYTIRGSGDVKITNVETTNFPDFGPFSDSSDKPYKGTVTNDVSEKSAWYGNQGVVVYFHLEIYNQQGVLLTSSSIVPFTCP